MRLRLRIPNYATSTVESAPSRSRHVLDGSDVVVANRWKIPANTVALVGRPAVWFSIDLRTPDVRLGPLRIPSRHLVWEQDFGGHLFVAITDDDPAQVQLIEAGPMHPNGSGALVPFAYPEEEFAERGLIDFSPIAIAPPNGMSEAFFAGLVRRTQRDYDGNQRYLAVEIPFLRVGRDSNSYAVGVLLCCGVDVREIPRPAKRMRFEWIGYPGMDDPVHRSNFGVYLGAPTPLGGEVVDVAYHNEDGSVRFVLVGGPPNGFARLPDGSSLRLDRNGRIALAPDDARGRGLPTNDTPPPQQIRARSRFPAQPAAAGNEITLVVDGRSVPLVPGVEYRGHVVNRHDGLRLAHLRTRDGSDVVLPLTELGIELRDPKRVDRLLRVGTEITLGLHRDRHPKLVAHGERGMVDRLHRRRFHLPRPRTAVGFAALGSAVVVGFGALWCWYEYG